jgi:hypothetical protein
MLTYKIAQTSKPQNASSSSVNIINEWTIIKEYKKQLGEHEISMVSPDIFDIRGQELDVPPSCNISKYVVSEDGKRAYFQLDMISAHYKSGTYESSGDVPPSAQPPHTCYIITNLNLKLLCDTYIPEETTKVIEIKPTKSRKSISISSTLLTNKTVVTKGGSTSYEFANELADDIFSNYNSGRMYGELTTYYTDFYEPNTNLCVFNGVSGKMIKPNDLIVLDYEYGLSETMFLVVGVEYLVMENKLIIKFVKNKYISGFTQEYDTTP